MIRKHLVIYGAFDYSQDLSDPRNLLKFTWPLMIYWIRAF